MPPLSNDKNDVTHSQFSPIKLQFFWPPFSRNWRISLLIQSETFKAGLKSIGVTIFADHPVYIVLSRPFYPFILHATKDWPFLLCKKLKKNERKKTLNNNNVNQLGWVNGWTNQTKAKKKVQLKIFNSHWVCFYFSSFIRKKQFVQTSLFIRIAVIDTWLSTWLWTMVKSKRSERSSA